MCQGFCGVLPSALQEKDMQKQLPLFLCVFLGCLTVGLSLGTLPAYVQGSLHFSNLIVGLIIGVQSAATLASRHFSGVICDTRGSNFAVRYGVVLSALAGLLYLLSAAMVAQHLFSLFLLFTGRIVSGVGESLFITGALAWGIGLSGPQRSGKVMAWTGIAIYGAMACGAPLGMGIREKAGFAAVCWAVILFPLLGGLCISLVQRVPASGNNRVPFYKVMGKVGRPGAGLALGTVGFGCIASFISLYFTRQGWTGASLALAIFGASYIIVRLFFAHLPDKMGGGKVAFVSLCVEVIGQLLLWTASSSGMALAGAALTGVGFSLVFPSFGVAAVRKLGPENKGVALGAYVAFFDLALGVTGPLAGYIAGHLGYATIYALGALSAAVAALLSLSLRNS
jgi:predicted MFS family arabinose efflux permease